MGPLFPCLYCFGKHFRAVSSPLNQVIRSSRHSSRCFTHVPQWRLRDFGSDFGVGCHNKLKEVGSLPKPGCNSCCKQCFYGVTCAAWQACIDENAEMVQFLVESGSDINRGDNEGWTPLHAAASCGFIQIVK